MTILLRNPPSRNLYYLREDHADQGTPGISSHLSSFINLLNDGALTFDMKFYNISKTRPVPRQMDFLACHKPVKARSHGVTCDCDLLCQQMECCLRFSDFVHKVRWVWMRFPMYLHWDRTSQSHRMGVEPNCVRCRTHQCITCTWSCTIWTPSLTSTQSIFCIAVASKKIAPCERAFNVNVLCSGQRAAVLYFSHSLWSLSSFCWCCKEKCGCVMRLLNEGFKNKYSKTGMKNK